MGYRDDHFGAGFPHIEKLLPTNDGGNIIGIHWTLFENKGDRESAAEFYAKRIIISYQQLLRHTNILECGKARIFIDKNIRSIVEKYFDKTGLMPIVRYIDYPCHPNSDYKYPELTHRIALWNHPDFVDCEWKFSFDDDVWFFNQYDLPILNWQRELHTVDKNTIQVMNYEKGSYNPLEGYEKKYPYGINKLNLFLKQYASKLGTINIPIKRGSSFPELDEKWQVLVFYATGSSEILEKLKHFYEKYGNIILNDEAFLTFFTVINNIKTGLFDIPFYSVTNWFALPVKDRKSYPFPVPLACGFQQDSRKKYENLFRDAIYRG